MLCFSLLAVLLTEVALGTAASVGQDQSGSTFTASSDRYLMCDKCNWAAYSGASTSTLSSSETGSYWKLVCGGPKTNMSDYSWIEWNCAAGCTSCKQSVNLTLGGIIEAQYNEYSSFTTSTTSTSSGAKSGQVVVSFQCCPRVVKSTLHTDSTCSGSDKDTYIPAGCSGSLPGRSLFSTYTCEVDGDGVAPTHIDLSCFSDSPLYTTDACPSDVARSCVAPGLLLENDPCLLAGGVAGLFGTSTLVCEVDRSQQCLRVVDHEYYNITNMSETTTSDFSRFECGGLGTGGSSRRNAFFCFTVLAASLLLFVV